MYSWRILGALLLSLWFGWWGFNLGSRHTELAWKEKWNAELAKAKSESLAVAQKRSAGMVKVTANAIERATSYEQQAIALQKHLDKFIDQRTKQVASGAGCAISAADRSRLSKRAEGTVTVRKPAAPTPPAIPSALRPTGSGP